MRHYFVGILFGFLISNVVWAVYFYNHLDGPTEITRWIYESDIKKRAIAAHMSTPRMLIVSGSSSHFGISAKLLSERLEIPVVNLGIHAGLGLQYTLEQAKDLVRPGDTLLLSLEYRHYTFDREITRHYLNYITARDTDYFHNLPLIERYRIMLTTSHKHIRSGINSKRKTRKRYGYYDASTINEYGDETMHREQDVTEKMRTKVDNAKPGEYGNVIDPAHYSWQLLREFFDFAREKNIQIITAFPGYLNYPEYSEPGNRAFFDFLVDFYQQQDVMLLGVPKDFMYEREYFYDSQYHLTDVGMMKHTENLLDLLPK